MRIQKRLPALALSTALLLVPNVCFAAAGAVALSGFIQAHVISQALLAFWGISWAAMFYYAVRMVIDAYKDQAYTDVTNSFMHAFIGFSIIACATAFANAFAVGSSAVVDTTTVVPGALIPGITSVANFIIEMSGGIFVLMIVISGIRMVTTQGDSGAFEKAKHLLVINCAGVALMLIAGAIVAGVAGGGAGAGTIVTELRGVALFLLELFGFVCVIALIIAGVYLIVSIDESYRDKAKKIVIGTLITLVVIFAAYGIIVTFVP